MRLEKLCDVSWTRRAALARSRGSRGLPRTLRAPSVTARPRKTESPRQKQCSEIKSEKLRSPSTALSTWHSGRVRQVYFFGVGVAATHPPLPSLPPLSSHFIFAFSQSTLFVGVVPAACCANAAGANASTLTTAAIGISFMACLLRWLVRSMNENDLIWP